MTREEVRNQFHQFVNRYDIHDEKIRLKIKHTYKVAEICDEISESLGLSEEDKDIAWTIGMLHDVGRFEQLRMYGTFLDAKSVNHAQLGASILLRKELGEYESMIIKAVALHNVYQLPHLNDREQMFCDIIRDADKVDIIRVNRQSSLSDIYETCPEDFYTSEISDAVMEQIKNHETIDRRNKQTALDNLVGHISFVFGLVYSKSIELVKEQGYLEEMLNFPTKNEKAKIQLEMIQKEVHSYMDLEGM